MRDTDFRPPDPAAVQADWIRLEQTPGAGGATVRKLLAEFGSPQHIFEAGYREFTKLRKQPGQNIGVVMDGTRRAMRANRAPPWRWRPD